MTSTLVVTIFTYSIYAAFRINKDAIKEMSVLLKIGSITKFTLSHARDPNNQ